MKLRWTRAAIRDLGSIEDYISRENPAAAVATVIQVNRHIGLLTQHPGIGRPGRIWGTRQLVISGLPYVVAYRRGGEIVTVIRVLHGARNWPKRF